jgi:hypothetical protein
MRHQNSRHRQYALKYNPLIHPAIYAVTSSAVVLRVLEYRPRQLRSILKCTAATAANGEMSHE